MLLGELYDIVLSFIVSVYEAKRLDVMTGLNSS